MFTVPSSVLLCTGFPMIDGAMQPLASLLLEERREGIEYCDVVKVLFPVLGPEPKQCKQRTCSEFKLSERRGGA
jgi:hypothetical protein